MPEVVYQSNSILFHLKVELYALNKHFITLKWSEAAQDALSHNKAKINNSTSEQLILTKPNVTDRQTDR